MPLLLLARPPTGPAFIEQAKTLDAATREGAILAELQRGNLVLLSDEGPIDKPRYDR